MSLESALDEEMREVMALLEGRGVAPPRSLRAGSPAVNARAQSPATAASPVRSMLDIDDPPSARHAPIGPQSYSSMLDPIPLRNTSRGPVATSPPPTARGFTGPSTNPESAYQFEMMPTIEAHSMPKRVTQGGKKKQGNRAMSSVYGDASGIMGPGRGGLLGKAKSGSPGPGRSASPGGPKFNTINLKSDPNKFVTDSGKVIDMSNAYRRLSDAALLRAGGGLGALPVRKGSDPTKGETLAPGGGVRLAKDDSSNDEGVIDSSEDDDSDGSLNANGWGTQKRRGRRRTRTGDINEKHGNERREPKSLLAAAEDERRFC